MPEEAPTMSAPSCREPPCCRRRSPPPPALCIGIHTGECRRHSSSRYSAHASHATLMDQLAGATGPPRCAGMVARGTLRYSMGTTLSRTVRLNEEAHGVARVRLLSTTGPWRALRHRDFRLLWLRQLRFVPRAHMRGVAVAGQVVP